MENSASTPKCPGCQQPLMPGRAQGLCPRCLLARAALVTDAGEPATTVPLPELAAVAAAFPQLEILELVGRGGMGVVYRARQKSLNRLVALKLLAPERVANPQFAERFQSEARALAQLSHPNIVTIHDFGIAAPPTNFSHATAPFYYLLMEFVDGVNLRQAMQAGRFTPEQALAIVPHVCAALQFAHERGIVHRDIKPENLLLDKDGRVKIADFGIAKMLGAESVVGGQSIAECPTPPGVTVHTAAGTPHYMAPEQQSPTGRADHRADIYSLGVVLYELLTGELPGAQLEPPSHKVQIDVRLDEIVLRALATSPELRYATAAEFRTQLDTVSVRASLAGRHGPAPAARPRLMKTADGVLHTPEQLATFDGQFCVWRYRGQLLLDECQLMHSCNGVQTVIPLAAIRDVSIAQYPRTMNPVGVDVLSVTYEEAGQMKRVLLAPMQGWFALPGTWNARVADWHLAIRDAVARVTGREPTHTARAQVPMPDRSIRVGGMMVLVFLTPMLIPFTLLVLIRRSFNPDGLGVLFLVGVAAVGLWALVAFGRRFRHPAEVRTVAPWTRGLGIVLIAAALVAGVMSVSRFYAQRDFEAWGQAGGLQASKNEQAELEAELVKLQARSDDPHNPVESRRLVRERAVLEMARRNALMRSSGFEAALAKPQSENLGPMALLPALPLLFVGLWLLLRRGSASHAEGPPRRWMRWLGGGCLLLGLPLAAFGAWIAAQISRDPSWNPSPAEAFVTTAVALGSVVLIGGGLVLLALSRPGRRNGVSLMLTLFAAVLSAFVFRTAGVAPGRRTVRADQPPVTLTFEPVQRVDNVIIANLRSFVPWGEVELRAGLDGPPLPEAALVELPERLSGLPPALARSGVPGGNRPRHPQAAGSNVWQVGFVFPTVAAAEESFRNLTLQEFGELEPGPVDLFEVIGSDGRHYRGEVSFGPPVERANANWIALAGAAHHGDSSLELTWDVKVEGTVMMEGAFGTETRRVIRRTVPYRDALRMELTKLPGNRVRLVTRVFDGGSTQELNGDFEDLADALVGSMCLEARGTRGDGFELCRFEENPLTVQVIQGPAPDVTRQTAPSPRALWMGPLLVLLVTGLTALLAGGVVWLIKRRP